MFHLKICELLTTLTNMKTCFFVTARNQYSVENDAAPVGAHIGTSLATYSHCWPLDAAQG